MVINVLLIWINVTVTGDSINVKTYMFTPEPSLQAFVD